MNSLNLYFFIMSFPSEFNSNASLGGTGVTTGLDRLKLIEEERRKSAARRAQGVTSKVPGDIKGGSNFVIVNGRAINRANAGVANITRSTPSILTKDRGRITLDTPGITETQRRALEIISGQQQATFNTARQISAERRAQQLAGKSREEAQRIATKGTKDERIASPGLGDKVAFTRKNRNDLNTILQTQEVRQNAARLKFANKLIQKQTHTPDSANTLDDLAAQLANAPGQNLPVDEILISTDEFGDPVSPRNIKLQLENALLTGSDPQNLQLNLSPSGGVAPNPETIAAAIDEGFSQVLGENISGATRTTVGDNGDINIGINPDIGPQLRQQIGDIVTATLGKFFDLRGQGVEDFFQNPEGIKIRFNGEDFGVGGSGLLPEDTTNTGSPFDVILQNPILLLAVLGVIGFAVVMLVRRQ